MKVLLELPEVAKHHFDRIHIVSIPWQQMVLDTALLQHMPDAAMIVFAVVLSRAQTARGARLLDFSSCFLGIRPLSGRNDEGR